MRIDNHNHVKGPGDFLPPDDSVREAARERAVEILADIVLDEFVADAARRGEAMTVLTDGEYDAINAAYDLGPVAYWHATQTALRRALQSDATAEAARRVDAMEREDEADYCAEVAV